MVDLDYLEIISRHPALSQPAAARMITFHRK